jgi:hypothetical protein
VTWIAPDVERSEDYPARRNESEREMLRDWIDWHRATLLRKCAGLDATHLARRAVPPSNLSLLGLVRHMSDAERGWVRQVFRGEQVPDLYYRSDAPDADIEEADPAGAEEDFERSTTACASLAGVTLETFASAYRAPPSEVQSGDAALRWSVQTVAHVVTRRRLLDRPFGVLRGALLVLRGGPRGEQGKGVRGG